MADTRLDAATDPGTPLHMIRRLIHRLTMGVGLVLIVVSVTFVLINLAPGDPARLWIGPSAGAAELEAARHALGLDQPAAVRYLNWLAGFARGDWGTSLAQHRPVARVIADALPQTLTLSVLSLLITYIGGIIIGAVQAARQNTALDTSLTIGSLVAFGMPSYWLAIMLVLVFSYAAARFGWPEWARFPAMGVAALDADFLSPWAQFVDRAKHIALPLVTLGAIGVAGTARFVRGAVLDVRQTAWVRTAHAKGVAPLSVELRHVLRNALLPVVTLLGLSLPALISGAVFVEVIFAWPGMGREMVGAVAARDYPVLMVATALFGLLVVAGNMLADLLYAVVDPRLRRPAR